MFYIRRPKFWLDLMPTFTFSMSDSFLGPKRQFSTLHFGLILSPPAFSLRFFSFFPSDAECQTLFGTSFASALLRVHLSSSTFPHISQFFCYQDCQLRFTASMSWVHIWILFKGNPPAFFKFTTGMHQEILTRCKERQV